MRHILIGGNGFLGRELVRQLIAKDEEVVVVDLMRDLAKELSPLSERIKYVQADMTVRPDLDRVPLSEGDAVHHLASRLITPNKPRFGRDVFFSSCIVDGTRNVLAWLQDRRHASLVYWSSDMVYGPALVTPRPEDHPRHPYGPYGRAKVAAEDLLFEARGKGLAVTILRPRLIMGPGRLGILTSLFGLMDKGLPIPLIGDGTNRFQFVSVADCADASIRAVAYGYPDTQLNLGSSDPPTVYELMSNFLKNAGGRSRLVRTPPVAVKGILRGLHAVRISPMDPEQFQIADQDVTLDVSRAKDVLGWTPKDTDEAMLLAAYRSWREARPAA